MSLRVLARASALAALTIATTSAQAHMGQGAHGLMDGLSHPFGADHLLAMVAVGLWSVTALPARRVWQGPATFLGAMIFGAVLGVAGWAPPYMEHAISLSVLMFGLMLVLAQSGLPQPIGLGLVAVAATLHGLAHGVEAYPTGLATYGGGFLFTTAMLHGGGMALGLAIRRWMTRRSAFAFGALGTAFSGAGLYLFGQLAT